MIPAANIINLLVATRMSTLVGKFRLVNMSNWTSADLEKLKGLTLNKEITVNVTKAGDVNECFISNVQLNDGTVIDDLSMCFRVDGENKAESSKSSIGLSINDIEGLQRMMQLDKSARDVANVTENMKVEETEIHLTRNRGRKIVINAKIQEYELLTAEYQVKKFSFSSAKFFDDRLMLKPQIKEIDTKISWLEEYFEMNADNFELITDIDLLRNSPGRMRQIAYHCLVKRDSKFFRAKVLKIDCDDEVTLLLVDVPEIVQEIVKNGRMYVMDWDLFSIPCANISVKLRTNDASSEHDELRINALIDVIDSYTKDEKLLEAKIYEYRMNNAPVVELFDPETKVKLA